MPSNSSTPRARSSAAKAEGAQYFKAGDYAAAASLFTRAIALGSDEPHALHANTAACYAAMNEHAKALESADAAVRCNPSFMKAHYRRALALQTGHPTSCTSLLMVQYWSPLSRSTDD